MTLRPVGRTAALRKRWSWVLLAALSACSDPSVLSVQVTAGQETDALRRDPAIARVDITATSAEGDLSLSASAAPGGHFGLGEVPETRLMSFEAVGVDVDGAASVRGRSVSVIVGGIEGGIMPLFVGRVGEWARPPSGLPHGRVGAIAAALGERYLWLAGGASPATGGPISAATPAYYDLLGLGPAYGSALPRVPKSLMMGADGSSAVLVDDDGASWVDFVSGSVSTLTPPVGLGTFADVAGGAVVEAPDGARYLVGATRTSSATDAILVWEPGQAVRAARLAFARRAAAASWLDGLGLVVAAGHATAPAIEVLGSGASATATRPFGAAPTVGAAAVARSAAQVLLLGGTDEGVPAAARVFDASCASDCEPTVLDVQIDAALEGCSAFSIDADHVVLVGGDVDDVVDASTSSAYATRTFVVDVIDQQASELVLREPRAGASAVATPHGLLALVGGMHRDGSAATSVELLYPVLRSP